MVSSRDATAGAGLDAGVLARGRGGWRPLDRRRARRWRRSGPHPSRAGGWGRRWRRPCHRRPRAGRAGRGRCRRAGWRASPQRSVTPRRPASAASGAPVVDGDGPLVFEQAQVLRAARRVVIHAGNVSPGLAGRPDIVTTVPTSNSSASWIAPRSTASSRAPSTGWSGLPAALNASRRKPREVMSRRRMSRAAGSVSSSARSACGAGDQPPWAPPGRSRRSARRGRQRCRAPRRGSSWTGCR